MSSASALFAAAPSASAGTAAPASGMGGDETAQLFSSTLADAVQGLIGSGVAKSDPRPLSSGPVATPLAMPGSPAEESAESGGDPAPVEVVTIASFKEGADLTQASDAEANDGETSTASADKDDAAAEAATPGPSPAPPFAAPPVPTMADTPAPVPSDVVPASAPAASRYSIAAGPDELTPPALPTAEDTPQTSTPTRDETVSVQAAETAPITVLGSNNQPAAAAGAERAGQTASEQAPAAQPAPLPAPPSEAQPVQTAAVQTPPADRPAAARSAAAPKQAAETAESAAPVSTSKASPAPAPAAQADAEPKSAQAPLAAPPPEPFANPALLKAQVTVSTQPAMPPAQPAPSPQPRPLVAPSSAGAAAALAVAEVVGVDEASQPTADGAAAPIEAEPTAPAPAHATPQAPTPVRASLAAHATSGDGAETPLSVPADGSQQSSVTTSDAPAPKSDKPQAVEARAALPQTPVQTSPDLGVASADPNPPAGGLTEARAGDAGPATNATAHVGTALSRATIETTAHLAAQIARKLEGRSTRFDMVLTPEDLGRVDVSLEIGSDGQLAARLAFDNPAAASELRARADELRRQLQEAGFQLSNDSLDFSQRDSSSGGGFDRQRRQREGLFADASRLNAQADIAAAPHPGAWSNRSQTRDRVDLRV